MNGNEKRIKELEAQRGALLETIKKLDSQLYNHENRRRADFVRKSDGDLTKMLDDANGNHDHEAHEIRLELLARAAQRVLEA